MKSIAHRGCLPLCVVSSTSAGGGQWKSQFLLLGSASIDLIGRHRNRWPADSRRERHLQYLGIAAPFFLTPHLASNSDICSLFVRSSRRQGAVIEEVVRCTGRTPVAPARVPNANPFSHLK